MGLRTCLGCQGSDGRCIAVQAGHTSKVQLPPYRHYTITPITCMRVAPCQHHTTTSGTCTRAVHVRREVRERVSPSSPTPAHTPCAPGTHSGHIIV